MIYGTIHYGSDVKTLREKSGMTQAQLGEILGVTDKAVSKWETAKGLPDITLIEPLAKALGVSVPELLHSISGSPYDEYCKRKNYVVK